MDVVRVHSGAGRAHAGPGAPGGVLPGAGCLAAWQSPRHEPTDRAQVAEPGPPPAMPCRELAPVHIPDSK